jgi:hypothetical protein
VTIEQHSKGPLAEGSRPAAAATVEGVAAVSGLIHANEIAGQKTHYYNGHVDNDAAATTFAYNATTYRQAEAALSHYYAHTPGGWLKPMHLWLNGTYVNKPGMHGKGRAIDVAYVYMTVSGTVTQTFNADYAWWHKQPNSSTYRKRYWAYVASLNRYFNPVLHYWFTPDHFSDAADYSHQHHVHYDDGTSGPGREAAFLGRSGRTVQTYAVQSCLSYIWGISVGIDGQFGPKTDKACRTALTRLGRGGGMTDTANYHAFLDETVRAGSGLYIPS